MDEFKADVSFPLQIELLEKLESYLDRKRKALVSKEETKNVAIRVMSKFGHICLAYDIRNLYFSIRSIWSNFTDVSRTH